MEKALKESFEKKTIFRDEGLLWRVKSKTIL